MYIFAIIGTTLIAWLLNFITRPLLLNKISQFWIFIVNTLLAIIILVSLVFSLDINEAKAYKLLPSMIIAWILLPQIMSKLPGGEESLKTWHQVPEDEDDKEYFSKKDMHGKPWWKFMYINSWITLIVFNLPIIIGLIVYILNGESLVLGMGIISTLSISPIIIWLAIKRKRDYDNSYK